MRRMPTDELPEWTAGDGGRVTQVRAYEVMTPLFGGGVETQQADPVTIVRAGEVRGQLRFWWRATRSARFDGDVEAMKRAEDKLWGSTTHASLVDVEVQVRDRGVLIEHVPNRSGKSIRIGAPASPISYAAFPLREGGGLRFGVACTLTISFPRETQHYQDVMAALWAWETFGGLGARTRRGFGALACHSITADGTTVPVSLPRSANAPDVRAWLTEQLAAHVVAGSPIPEVPHVTRTTSSTLCRIPARFTLNNRPATDIFRELLRAGGIAQPPARMLNALVAWYYPIERMKTFRQSRRRSETNGSRFGRSYWPEPDEIRARTRGFRGRHERRLTTAPKFPRAVFGLPIVFQFKDSDIDPDQTTLQGAQHDRLASRLILRPLACADDQVAGVATLLDCPELPPGGLKLEGDQSERPTPTARLAPAEATFAPLNGNPDVLQAFLATL